MRKPDDQDLEAAAWLKSAEARNDPDYISDLEEKALAWAQEIFDKPKASTNMDKGLAAVCIALLKLAQEWGKN